MAQTKRKKEEIDYSKLSLEEIVFEVTRKREPVWKLRSDKRRSVMKFISEKGLSLRAFGSKWYDILSNRFFLAEYKYDEKRKYDAQESILVFNSFGELFSIVHNEIYERSCFFGYSFSKEEIEKFGLDLRKLNFDSFITETINYDLPEITKPSFGEERWINSGTAGKITSYIKSCRPIKTFSGLKNKFKQFRSLFPSSDACKIFFSIILRRDREVIKEAAITYFCQEYTAYYFNLGDIIILFGKEAAACAVDNFNRGYNARRKKEMIKYFKALLVECEECSSIEIKNSGFDREKSFYYVVSGYRQAKSRGTFHTDYFETFDEYAAFLGGNLRGADLEDAPVEKTDIQKYKTDNKTVFPTSRKIKSLQIKKEYNDKEKMFYVWKYWLNDENKVVETNQFKCLLFFDFVHFLKGNLSNSNLLMCDGLERIKGLKTIKLDGSEVRSDVAKSLNLPVKLLPKDYFKPVEFSQSFQNEKTEKPITFPSHVGKGNYDNCVSYISDIHLIHHLKTLGCKTISDIKYALNSLSKNLVEQGSEINIFAGDVCSDFNIFKYFVKRLSYYNKGKCKHFFFVLGNRELWNFADLGYQTAIREYKAFFSDPSISYCHLVHNNLFYIAKGNLRDVSEEELCSLCEEELRLKLRDAQLVIFGGIGFSGNNDSFNADSGIYSGTVNRNAEKEESKKFNGLHKKVARALAGKNVVVATHMPKKDWNDSAQTNNGFVYLSGHNHLNEFSDDDKNRFYADNQIGYLSEEIAFKTFPINMTCDYFEDYPDGIYKITKEDYENYYYGLGERIIFNQQTGQLFLWRKRRKNMFLLKSEDGSISTIFRYIKKRIPEDLYDQINFTLSKIKNAN